MFTCTWQQGLIGVVAKPVTGILDGATSITSGVVNMATIGDAAKAAAARQNRRRPARLTWGMDRLLIAVTSVQVRVCILTRCSVGTFVLQPLWVCLRCVCEWQILVHRILDMAELQKDEGERYVYHVWWHPAPYLAVFTSSRMILAHLTPKVVSVAEPSASQPIGSSEPVRYDVPLCTSAPPETLATVHRRIGPTPPSASSTRSSGILPARAAGMWPAKQPSAASRRLWRRSTMSAPRKVRRCHERRPVACPAWKSVPASTWQRRYSVSKCLTCGGARRRIQCVYNVARPVLAATTRRPHSCVLHLLCAWQAFGIDAEVHSAGDWGQAIAKVREVDVNASPRDNAAALVRVARNKGTLITLYVTTNMCWPCIVQVQATTALSTVYASGRAARGNTGPAALAGAELMPLYQYILIQVRSRRACVCGLLVYLTEAISRAWLGAGRSTEPGVGPGPGGVRGWNACPFWHD